MNTNIPALATVYADLEAVLAKLQAISADAIESANLVPMVKAVQSIGAYAAAIDAQIQERAVTNNELLPGVVVKTTTTHRRWTEPETAAQLARECLGEAAFEPATLKSPAGIEKLGEQGKAFVAVASFKPEGSKRATY